MTGREPVVALRGIGKRFRIQRGWRDLLAGVAGARREADVRVALAGINLEIGQGEFFGLLGQNGAGKSTLFKILATLILPDEGSARVDGVDVTSDPAAVRRRLVPVIPSERSLYWRVSAAENLRLYAALYGLAGAEAERRVRDALEVVDLTEAGSKQVGLFSSGMKQRLLIARALLGSPRVLLLDEPTRSLDPVSAREFRRFLRDRVGREAGATVLLATHDHEEVTDLCDRVGVLDRGRLLAVGETERILAASKRRLYELWTPEPGHPALEAAVERTGGQRLGAAPAPADHPGWHRVRLELPVNEAGASEFLAVLAAGGVSFSRFERTDLSLADLLERVAVGAGAADPEAGLEAEVRHP